MRVSAGGFVLSSASAIAIASFSIVSARGYPLLPRSRWFLALVLRSRTCSMGVVDMVPALALMLVELVELVDDIVDLIPERDEMRLRGSRQPELQHGVSESSQCVAKGPVLDPAGPRM